MNSNATDIVRGERAAGRSFRSGQLKCPSSCDDQMATASAVAAAAGASPVVMKLAEVAGEMTSTRAAHCASHSSANGG